MSENPVSFNPPRDSVWRRSVGTAEDVVPGQHVPWCDSQLGPEFEVRDGAVHMTFTACTGCLPVEETPAK